MSRLMPTKFVSVLWIFAVMLSIGGCASSELSVRVDIYGDDPLLRGTLEVAVLDLERAISTAERYGSLRASLAESMVPLYVAYLQSSRALRGVDGAVRPEAEQRTALSIEDYLTEIERRQRLAVDAAQNALDRLDRIASQLDATDFDQEASIVLETQIGTILDNAAIPFRVLGEESYGSVFERRFAGFPDVIQDDLSMYEDTVAGLSDDQRRTFETQVARAREKLAVVASLLEELQEVGADLSVVAIERVRDAAGSDDEPATDLLRSVAIAASNVGPPLLETAAPGANAAFYTSQIDRIQDPADPAWRVVTAPENRDRWQQWLSKTEFYAEGDSSVVMVRERPGHFRVQRGTNNPTALIQGQLRINRALASGVIDIFASVAGVSGIPGLGSVFQSLDPGDPSPPDDPDVPGLSAQDVTSTRAAMSASVERTRLLRANLTSALNRLSSELQTVTPGSGEDQRIRSELKAILENHIDLLGPAMES